MIGLFICGVKLHFVLLLIYEVGYWPNCWSKCRCSQLHWPGRASFANKEVTWYWETFPYIWLSEGFLACNKRAFKWRQCCWILGLLLWADCTCFCFPGLVKLWRTACLTFSRMAPSTIASGYGLATNYHSSFCILVGYKDMLLLLCRSPRALSHSQHLVDAGWCNNEEVAGAVDDKCSGGAADAPITACAFRNSGSPAVLDGSAFVWPIDSSLYTRSRSA